MPDGSSSAAPVIIPGPRDFNSNRILRDGANFGTKESERKLPANHSANPLTILQGAPYKSPKVVQCDQTSASPLHRMLCSEEVRRPLQRPVQLLSTNEVSHDNYFDCYPGVVLGRRRGLGILSLAPLDRDHRMNHNHNVMIAAAVCMREVRL
jgi:hypothetical protein